MEAVGRRVKETGRAVEGAPKVKSVRVENVRSVVAFGRSIRSGRLW